MSGPAIKPIAIKLVWDAAQSTKLPIIGMGGIFEPEDAIEYMVAGATAVAVGTANFVDPATVDRVIDGIEAYVVRKGYSSVKDIVGTVQA